MKYNLIGNNDINNIAHTVLINRGIEDPEKYLNLDESVVQDYNDLNNMKRAVDCFVAHYNNHDPIAVLVDEDCDGYTSGAEQILYVKAIDESYPIKYILHSKPKSHGLNNYNEDDLDGIKLLIVPDGGTNDAEECNKLIDKGIDIIILDHHDPDNGDDESEEMTKNVVSENRAIIVNNQLSENYKNKDLSGAGIVYRFLQALDEELWEDHANDFLDLVCLGNVADMMSMKSFETRYIVNMGLDNINNNFLKSLAKAQEFSTKGILNVHNLSWYFAPVINSVTRIGSIEERELLFRAFIGDYEEFDYKKRGSTETIKENIYDRAARIAKNIKSRQDKQRDKIFDELKKQVNADDKVVILETKEGDMGLAGLSSIKIASTFNKPTIVVKKFERDGNITMCGSCRNFDDSYIDNFKKLILDTGMFEFCRGHANAAGLAILPENIEKAKDKFNEMLKDISIDTVINCDFELDIDDMNVSIIYDIDKLKWIWGQGIREPKILINNITVAKKDIIVQGKSFNSIAFVIDDIKYVAFSLKENDPILEFANSWDNEDDSTISINAIVECVMNEYNGVVTPQCIITNYEVIE